MAMRPTAYQQSVGSAFVDKSPFTGEILRKGFSEQVEFVNKIVFILVHERHKSVVSVVRWI